MNLFDKQSVIEEIFFRYSHEVNKIIFWLGTVRQIFNYLHQNKICKALLIFACLILERAKSRNKLLIQSLIQRENKYNLTRFPEFLESKKYELAIARLKTSLRQVRVMERSLQKIRRFHFFIKYYHLEKISKGGISNKEFQKIINSQLLGMIKEKLRKRKMNKKNHSLRYFKNLKFWSN